MMPTDLHSTLPRTTTVVAALVATGLGAAACASGGPASTPSSITTGELAGLHDAVRVAGLDDRRFQPEAYWAVALPVLERSDRFTVEEVGRSAEDRPLREVRFGNGPVRVLLWSQMHGDESTASMALADLFAFLGSDHPVAERLHENLTLHFIPVLNPDGAARFQRRNAQGIDVNRDARNLATPEGRTLKAVRDEVEPDFAFNLHDQNVGTRVGDSDRGVAIALLAPAFDDARNVNEARESAMRVASVIRQAIEPMVGGHIARYDDAFNARAFGDLMTQWGASTVLIESGGWTNDPQKQHLRKVNFVALVSALDAIATEGWREVGVAPYEDLPRNGRSIADLLLVGGTIAVPGLPELRADLLVDYERPLLEEGGTVADVGDLGGYEARDTIDVTGRYLIPMAGTIDRDGALKIGTPASFVVAEDPEGRRVLWRFEGGPPGNGVFR